MSCQSYRSPVQRHLTALSSAEVQYEWFTGWGPAIGVDTVKGVLMNRALTGNFESRLAMQTAIIRTDKPDAPALLEASYLGQGERCSGVLNVASSTASKYYVRFGLAYHLSSGSTPGQADASVELSWDACGRVVGGRVLELCTPDTSSRHAAITDWFPAIHADKVKAILVVSAAVGNFRCQLAYRLATSSREDASGWSTNFEGAWHTGNGEFPTGEVSTSGGAAMWMQLGVEHSLSSGTNGGAMVATSASIRRS